MISRFQKKRRVREELEQSEKCDKICRGLREFVNRYSRLEREGKDKKKKRMMTERYAAQQEILSREYLTNDEEQLGKNGWDNFKVEQCTEDVQWKRSEAANTESILPFPFLFSPLALYFRFIPVSVHNCN